MSDLVSIDDLSLPHAINQAFDHAQIQSYDLLTLSSLEISRRTKLSVLDVNASVRNLIKTLSVNEEVGKTVEDILEKKSGEVIRTGDGRIDDILGGGIRTGYITEISGESGTGKTQLSLRLTLQTLLPRQLGGLSASTIYISTESALPTPRLFQLAQSFSLSLTADFQNATEEQRKVIPDALRSLKRPGDHVYYYSFRDLETQEHVVKYQLPVMLERYSPIGLIVLDSITSNYRAEFANDSSVPNGPTTVKGPAKMAQRARDLRNLASILRALAVEWNVAIVVTNQVSDVFNSPPISSHLSEYPISPTSSPMRENMLTLNYQSLWTDGLFLSDGETVHIGGKRPALGGVWANEIDTRVILQKAGMDQNILKVIFSPFARSGEVAYRISREKGVCSSENGYDIKQELAVYGR